MTSTKRAWHEKGSVKVSDDVLEKLHAIHEKDRRLLPSPQSATPGSFTHAPPPSSFAAAHVSVV